MFNKTLFENYDLEYPYQAVRDGKWTLDMLYELAKTVPTASNGNGTTDYADLFGCLDERFDAISRVHGADAGDIGIVPDALSYLSYVDVEPMYAETYLENRYLRDEDSVEMLNIVIQNKTYDAAFLLNYAGANSLPQECSAGRGDKIASTIASKRSEVEKEVQKALQVAGDMK